jgi:hypothetical protein
MIMLIKAVLATAIRAIAAKSRGGIGTGPAFTTSSSGPDDFAKVAGSTTIAAVKLTTT